MANSSILGPSGAPMLDNMPGFPCAVDLRWGATDAELCRVIFDLDENMATVVTCDPQRLRTFLRKTTAAIPAPVRIQWWTILALVEANMKAPAGEPAPPVTETVN